MKNVVLLILLFSVLTATAQTSNQQPSSSATAGGDIVQVIAAVARPGSEAQYLEGRKRHMEWHRAQNAPWAWHTYNVVSGPSTGMLVTVSAPHKFADRDAREQFFRDDQ